MRAHQIMTRPVITVLANTTIVEAANIMLRRHISGLPVVDAAGKLIGIVSEGDFIRRSEIGTQRKRNRLLKFILGAGQAATDFVHENGRRISEVMTSDPVTITEDTPLEEIVTLMQKRGIKRLPVIRGERLMGIVSRANLLHAVASLARQILDPTADDDHIRDRIIYALGKNDWCPRTEPGRPRRHRASERHHYRRAFEASCRRPCGEHRGGEEGLRSSVLGRPDVRDVFYRTGR
jgi:CBS domain-containing protein